MRAFRFRSRLPLGLLLAVLLLWLQGATAPARADDPGGDGRDALGPRLERVLRSRALRGARVGALVVRSSDGSVLFARDPDRPLTPASNLKVLTAIAVLDAYGPAHTFETLVRADAEPDPSGGVDTLYVVGGGDPVMNSEDWWQLASRLRRAGLRHVRGDVVLDDGLFDHERWHPSWGRTSSRAYHAPVGALTANYGTFGVTVTPGERPGDAVRVEVDPPVPYLAVANRARTGTSRGRRFLLVERTARPGGELVTVKGTLPAGGPSHTYWRSVLDPTRYAGAVLRMQLEANGIAVDGDLRVATAPADAPVLVRFHGRPLAEIVRLFVKYSNNATAEALVKDLAVRAQHGRNGASPPAASAVAAAGEGASPSPIPASWPAGVRELEHRLVGLGLDPAGFSLVDGSGLSYENKVTPRTLVEALRRARTSFRFGPELMAALPIASRDGTLQKRAEGAEDVVRAKTGLLTRVTALSGFAELPDGERAVFSILVNGYRGSDREAMDAVDRFVSELVRGGPVVTSRGG